MLFRGEPRRASFASFASSRYRLHAAMEAMDNLDESNPKKTNRLQVKRVDSVDFAVLS